MQEKFTSQLISFRDARDWEKYHTGPELARSLTIEATELNRLFQWGDEPTTTAEYNNLGEEIADIQIYLLYLAEKYNINIENEVEDKIVKNAVKYPAIYE